MIAGPGKEQNSPPVRLRKWSEGIFTIVVIYGECIGFKRLSKVKGLAFKGLRLKGLKGFESP